MRPSERLLHELQRHREQGRSFRSAWPAAVSMAVRDLPLSMQVERRGIFAESRTVWMLSYSKVAWPAKDRMGSMFVPDGEHGVRSNRAIIA